MKHWATSCLHLARSLAVGLSLASLQSTPIVSKSSFIVSCHVLIGLPTLLLPPSRIHLKARLAGLVAGSHRMCPTNRLLLVATMLCNADCLDRAITSSFVTWSRHEMSKMLLRHIRRKTSIILLIPLFVFTTRKRMNSFVVKTMQIAFKLAKI